MPYSKIANCLIQLDEVIKNQRVPLTNLIEFSDKIIVIIKSSISFLTWYGTKSFAHCGHFTHTQSTDFFCSCKPRVLLESKHLSVGSFSIENGIWNS